MKICVVGTGYVGLVTGTCLADFGNKVICVDSDKNKIMQLSEGKLPIFEPGIKDLLFKNMNERRLFFSANIQQAISQTKVIFITVGTPSREDGAADITSVLSVARLIAKNLNEYKIIVIKSTVPIGTTKTVKRILKEEIKQIYGDMEKNNKLYAVVHNPEFIRQGKALMDFMQPHRTIIGSRNPKAINILKKIYQSINAPVMVTSSENAEIIKYASNSFLALKISYINELANLCEKFGADVKEVAKGMGLDKRIGDRFLEAGIGFGGSCFPKDTKAFLSSANEVNYDFKLLKAALAINECQKSIVVSKLKRYLRSLKGKTIGLWGLAFKPNTDDVREAPSVTLIRKLLDEGAKIKAHDPQAERNIKKIFPELKCCSSPYEVARGSHAVVLVTEWEEYAQLDLAEIKTLLKNPIIIDGRNLFDPARARKMGFCYEGIGRL